MNGPPLDKTIIRIFIMLNIYHRANFAQNLSAIHVSAILNILLIQ